jgi:hypothetical protein
MHIHHVTLRFNKIIDGRYFQQRPGLPADTAI